MSKNLLSPEQNAKVKKNLLWVFIFAVIMMFAGFTSAYLVYRGSTFWVRVPLPEGFIISTITIILSSTCLVLAVFAVKKSKAALTKAALGGALIGGILFGAYQFIGFKQLFDSGNRVSGPIIENSGRYGFIFTLSYEGKSLSFENDEFYWKGQPISEEMHQSLIDFGAELEDAARTTGDRKFDFDNYGSGWLIYMDDKPITYANQTLYFEDQPLEEKRIRQLYEFGENLHHERGDFIMKGKYGEDFIISYDGNDLEYTNRTFYMNGQRLSPKLENELMGATNAASSFIYVLAGVHLLHWIGGIIALLVVFIRGLGNKYTSANYLGISLGSIYWHFLGILWLFLYGFLIFIH